MSARLAGGSSGVHAVSENANRFGQWVREGTAMAGVAAMAFFLRVPGLWWGLPDSQHYFSYHPDEIFLLKPSFYFAQGDWNPHFFNYGTLYIYLVGIPALLSHVVPEVARFPSHLGPLYELGRAVTMAMAAATVLLVYLAARREGRGFALLASALLAFCPLHVANSAYATVDVPATFWLTLAFLLALLGADRANAKWGLLVGLAVGLAAATKYNAGLFLVPALLAPVIVRPRTWRWSWCLAGIAGAVLGFVVGCPFFWTQDFFRDFTFELHHARVGGTLAFVNTGSGWIYHLVHGLPVALGYPLLAAVVLGAVAAVRLPSRAARLSLLWVVFYLLVIGFGKERFIRYLVPLTPFLCVLAALPVLWALAPERSNRWLARTMVGTLVFALAALTWFCAIGQVANFVGFDPQGRAGSDLAKLMYEFPTNLHAGIVEAPWFSDPPLSPYNAGPFSRPLFDQWNRETGNRIVVTGWDADKLRAEKPDVFFLSDLESQDLVRLRRPEALSFVAALDQIYRHRRVFARPEVPFAWLAPPRSWAPPDWLYPSPRITMYYNYRT